MNNHEMERRPIKEGPIPKSQLNFYELVNHLSEVKRQGWLDRGIEHPESVADHSYAVAMMSNFEAARRGLDVQKTTTMALIHDLPEIYSGDITPHQNLPEEQRAEALYQWIPPTEEAIKDKHKKEEKALQKIVKGLPAEFRTSIVELWQEYNEEQTEEAKLVHRIDRMQRLLQAKKYRNQEGVSFAIDSFLQEALVSDDLELRRLAKGIQKDMN